MSSKRPQQELQQLLEGAENHGWRQKMMPRHDVWSCPCQGSPHRAVVYHDPKNPHYVWKIKPQIDACPAMREEPERGQ